MYTLVRHSGYTMAAKLEFRHAVELCEVKKAGIKKVKSVGGCLFDTYTEASDAEMRMNYPPEMEDENSLIPNAKGTFSRIKVDGSPIYIPDDEYKSEEIVDK